MFSKIITTLSNPYICRNDLRHEHIILHSPAKYLILFTFKNGFYSEYFILLLLPQNKKLHLTKIYNLKYLTTTFAGNLFKALGMFLNL